MAFKHIWKVDLIPWDHLSEDQVTRLYNQREACGWRKEEVPSYVEAAKKGGKIFYWVVLSDAVPDREGLLETHTRAYPKEATCLLDTAREVRLVPREPTRKEFLPIGHVALDVHTPEEDAELGLPSEGVVWLHQLYVSYALQHGGFGAATMDQAEALAVQPPLNGRLMVLDTMAPESQLGTDTQKSHFAEMGIPIPSVSTEAWYRRRGYELFHQKRAGYIWGDGLASNVSFLRKEMRAAAS